MALQTVLDLKGLPSAISLLKCKSCLRTLAPDDVLELYIQDLDLADDLETIVKRSRDSLVLHEDLGDCLRLIIRKGNELP